MVPYAAPKRTNRQLVYDALRSRIILNELQPGATLSEHEIAASLGVSRTPVREAIVLLVNEGLVRVYPKVGTFVSRVDPAQVAEAQFLREAVELASLASMDMPPDSVMVGELQRNLDEQRSLAQQGGKTTFFALDEAFHQGLMRMSGHEASWRTVDAAKGHLDRARMVGIRNLPILDHLVTEHQSILDAVRAGDKDAACANLRAHLRTVFVDLEKMRQRSPELFDAAPGPDAVPSRRSVVVWT